MTRRNHRRWLLLAVVAIAACFFFYHRKRPTGYSGARRLPDFHLSGLDGKRVGFPELAGEIGVVLFFTGDECPNSNRSIPRLVGLAREYGPKGFSFHGVNSNAGEFTEAVAQHAGTYGISFPVWKDPNNFLADLLGVERTCEVVVLDVNGVVRYHGALDDQWGRGVGKPAPRRHFLVEALESLLAGRRVEVAATKVIGCPIERVKPKKTLARVRPASSEIVLAMEEREKRQEPIEVGLVSYSVDVAPILQRKCQPCHRPGQEAPFSLLSFEDARTRSASIQEVVAERRMPPWHADPRHGHFANDRSLTVRERATLLAWVEQGTPPGDLTRLPPPRSFSEEWSIGKPDVVFEIPQANEIPPVGVLDYVIVKVPTHFQEDMWIQGAEIRPEIRSVVHHIIVQILDSSEGRMDRGDHLATYVPGDAPTSYPTGVAKKIPAGSWLKFGIHYTPDGIARTDRSKIGLVFAKGPVRHQAFTRSVESISFAIPPHADNHPVRSTYTAETDFNLYSFSPHMHVRGKDFRYTATYPDGRVETLLSVPAYDFGWQSTYILAEPKAIPRGTRIDCLAHFDNSANNPANPDPSRTVEWGEQSFHEMMIGYFDYVLDAPADPKW